MHLECTAPEIRRPRDRLPSFSLVALSPYTFAMLNFASRLNHAEDVHGAFAIPVATRDGLWRDLLVVGVLFAFFLLPYLRFCLTDGS